jgi:tetratricopeptide (TPR) repeat protein
VPARHATYYRRWLEQSGSDWSTLSTGPERSPHFAALNNARAALEWCFGERGDVQLGIKLAAAAAPVFLAMSLLTECYRWSQRAIAAIDDKTRGGADEMRLQAGMGVALTHIHGPSETARAPLNRGLAIAEARGDVVGQVRMLRTLTLFSQGQGELKVALDYAKRACAVAEAINDPDATAHAQSALGMTLYFMGDQSSRPVLEAAFQYWSRTRGQYLGFDNSVFVAAGLARALWLHGFPARALERAHQTVHDAKQSGNPASLALALSWVPTIFMSLGDLRSAEQHADWLIPHAEHHSLGPYLHVGQSYKSMLAIYRDDAEMGVQTLQGCLKGLRALHYEIRNTEFEIALTQGLTALGRVDEALAVIDETIRHAEESGEFYFLPEALRMRGCAILASPERRLAEAEACFTQSLELSHHQGARAWELRTAIDLARLWADHGKSTHGRSLLQPIFEQFTEGHDTADLQTSANLLAELAEGE